MCAHRPPAPRKSAGAALPLAGVTRNTAGAAPRPLAAPAHKTDGAAPRPQMGISDGQRMVDVAATDVRL